MIYNNKATKGGQIFPDALATGEIRCRGVAISIKCDTKFFDKRKQFQIHVSFHVCHGKVVGHSSHVRWVLLQYPMYTFSVVCYCVALEISLNTLENVEGSHPKTCKALKCWFFFGVCSLFIQKFAGVPRCILIGIYIYIFSYSVCRSCVLEPEHGFLKMPIHLSPSMRGSGPCKYSFKLLQGFKYNKQEKWVILRE